VVAAAAATMVVVMRCLHVAKMGSEHTTTDSGTSTLKDFILLRKGRNEKRALVGKGSKMVGGKRSKETKNPTLSHLNSHSSLRM